MKKYELIGIWYNFKDFFKIYIFEKTKYRVIKYY